MAEAIGQAQRIDLVAAIAADTGAELAELRVDGGAAANNLLLGGDGWICPQQDTLVVCTSTKPLEQGQTYPIQVVTHATGGQSTIPLLVEVTGTDGNGNPLTDPKPEDNKVDRITDLDRFYLFGGGLSCSLAPGSQLSGSAASAMLLLVAMMMLAWRRRRAVA